MGQLKQLFESLSLRQRLSIVAALAAVGALVYFFVHWKKEQDFTPLYTNLAPEDAGAIVQKLKERAVEYRLVSGGAGISVPSARVAETRLFLAGNGLPKSGRIGFELFDKTNLGVTEFTEHINYRRALEGELERSILALNEIEHARVHITFPKDSVFLESRQPAKASIMIRTRSGERLTPDSVRAMTHLVASAVEGLSWDAVSVVDTRGILLSRPHRHDNAGSESLDTTLELRQSMEQALLAKVNQALETVLGPGKFHAGVSIECDPTFGEESEEIYDPTRSVMVTSQKSEDVIASGGATGVPGSSSNVPHAAANTVRAPKSGATTRRTENLTLQTTKMVRRMNRPKGVVKRMSVAVLVDHTVRWEKNGDQSRRVVTPPSPETLKVIRDVVAGVSGLNTERGDSITIDTLPFETTLSEDPPRAPGIPAGKGQPGDERPWWMKLKEDPRAIAAAVLVAASALFFLRPRRKRGRAETARALPGQTADDSTRPAPGRRELAAGGAGEAEASLAGGEGARIRGEAEGLKVLPPAAQAASRSEAMLKHLQEEVKRDAKGSAQLLRTWLLEEEA